MTIVMAQQGWQCPKCGNIISPNMMWCPFCSGEKKVTYTTTTSTPYKVDTSSICKDKPQTYITEDRDTQILDAWQVHHRSTTSVEDEPQTDCAWK